MLTKERRALPRGPLAILLSLSLFLFLSFFRSTGFFEAHGARAGWAETEAVR